MRRVRWALLVLPVLVLAACSGGSGDPPAAAPPSRVPSSGTSSGAAATGPDWPTYGHDAARSGVASGTPTPSAADVVARVRLDGAVYAAPLVVGGTVVVATENDTVYGLDPTGAQRWRAHLGQPSPQSERQCGNIDPLGVTGTPVVVGGVVYVAAEYGGPPAHQVRHELVALSLSDGAVRWRASLDLPGVDTTAMQERGALTVAGGRVWVPFGGQAGDCGDYLGRVVGVPMSGQGAPIAWTVPTTREGGIWTPPGPAVDDTGALFVSVGNGEAGADGAYDGSDSVVRIDPATARRTDFFAPRTWAADNEADRDLGSQGPALVGPWVLIAGKSGTAYVLRRDHLGGIGGEVSSAQVCHSFGGTAVQGSTAYLPCTDGVRAVTVDDAGRATVRWQAATGTTGAPVVAGGRVWSLDTGAGVLHALDPATGRSTLQVGVGAVTRFASLAVSGPLIAVPTTDGVTLVRVRGS